MNSIQILPAGFNEHLNLQFASAIKAGFPSPAEDYHRDWLAENDFVEYEQRNNICVNNIVYLYSTATVQRIEFQMIAKKIDLPWEGTIDDSRFSPLTQSNRYVQKSVGLRLLEKANTPILHLTQLRKYGLKSSMQSHFKILGELLDDIVSFLEK